MRLAFPTLLLVLYIVLSLILWLPCRPWAKVAAGLCLCVVGLKYIFYEQLGGSFIAPDFPTAVLLVLEFCYTALVLLAFLLVIKDLLTLLLLISRLLGTTWHLPGTPGLRSVLLCGFALALAGYASWQAVRVPRVHTVEIPLPGLPAALDGVSLVQLSDIHIGPILKRQWLAQVVAQTNALEPDLIVLTGDMIDGSPEKLRREIAPLGQLRSHLGVFAVTGNHEYYFGAEHWRPEWTKLGVVLLDNQYQQFTIQGQSLVLAGLPDPVARRFGDPISDRVRFVQALPPGTRVLLQHRPAALSEQEDIALQLSGHTHGGHLFFLQWLIGSYNGNLTRGLFDFQGAKLYVSPGTGVWAGFSCRLGVPAEITQVILRQG